MPRVSAWMALTLIALRFVRADESEFHELVAGGQLSVVSKTKISHAPTECNFGGWASLYYKGEFGIPTFRGGLLWRRRISRARWCLNRKSNKPPREAKGESPVLQDGETSPIAAECRKHGRSAV